jgi:hypothetical protein
VTTDEPSLRDAADLPSDDATDSLVPDDPLSSDRRNDAPERDLERALADFYA